MGPSLRGPRVAGLLLLAGAAAAGYAVWRLAADDPAGPRPAVLGDPPPPPPPADPRYTFFTPYRNVRPEVKYVGDAACAGCHAGIDKSYHQHPMGRSAELVGKGPPLERYDATARNPFEAKGYTLRADPAGGKVVHRVSAKDAAGNPLPDYTRSVDLAIGSGTRGRSYVSFEHGAAWQSPLSWYSSDGGRWDQSPGYDLGTGGRREVIPECLFCHVDRVEPVKGSRNRYKEPLIAGQAAIGCERCHGPGGLHVAERGAGPQAAPGPDTSIVNPKHLSPELRSSVCEQCHLQGQERVTRRGRDIWEFRPGLPFDQFVSVFVRHPDLAEAHRSVGQFEQMEQSRCFVSSAGKLGCVSCHDPHGVPAADAKPAFYRAKCLTCHERKGCTAPPADRQARADSCVACHMPRADSANIVHASVTDHRIPRRPTPPAARQPLAADAFPLLPFRVGPFAPPETDRERDYGVVLARAGVQMRPGSAARGSVLDAGEFRLSAALPNWPLDWDGWLALGAARAARGDHEARYQAAARALRAAPGSEVVLADLAEAAAAAGRFDEALAAADEWARRSPSDADARVARAWVFVRRRDWAKAEAASREALAVHPLLARPRLYLALCKDRQGDPAGGRKDADTALGLVVKPDRRDALREWYDRETKAGP